MRLLLLLVYLLVPVSAAAQTYQHIEPWPGGVLPIQFDGNATPEQQERLFTACRMWSAVANVRCIPRTTEVPYVQVNRFGEGCAAGIGAPQPLPPVDFIFADPNATTMHLAASCYGGWLGNDTPGYYALVHELGHVFGLIHEHQREDRDDHLQVDWAQVEPPYASAYNRLQTNIPQTTPYDYHSVMHYAGPFLGLPEGVWPGGLTITELDGQDLAAIYGPPPVLELTVVQGSCNPVHLAWQGGNGLPFYILAGSVPGGYDYGLFPMGSETSIVAEVPRGVLIYVTIGQGTGWEDARFSNTVSILVP